ncbi:HNH endonuclease [Camelliibacillus cellulosilyticus]|uniref:HNH endonuclease n=1 Tax=Camelliibacillus cellulosilyticus TaxID=2174486 RepID=A0ABV9GT54_9BACL
MGEIKVKPDQLEAFADKIGKAEDACDDALRALKWHFTSLLARVTDMESPNVEFLHHDLIKSIEKYQHLLDDSQALLMKTAAEFREADKKWYDYAIDFGAEVLPIYDIERIFGEYDPVTGEKLTAGDRLLAGGMTLLTLIPEAKVAAVGVKTGVKGAKTVNVAEKVATLQKIKNVLHPNVIKTLFDRTLESVKNQSLSLTRRGFEQFKKLGDIRIPQIFQREYVGYGKEERTLKDTFKDAKELLMQAAPYSFKDGDEVKTINLKMGHQKGQKHPVTGVPYDKDGFPIFDSKFEAKLDPRDFKKTRMVHFRKCNKKLYQEIERNPELIEKLKLSKQDLEELANGQTPYGYTWHHHQDRGKMQLVNQKIHKDTGHTGGYKIWGPESK